jgi:hypothetical protein
MRERAIRSEVILTRGLARKDLGGRTFPSPRSFILQRLGSPSYLLSSLLIAEFLRLVLPPTIGTCDRGTLQGGTSSVGGYLPKRPIRPVSTRPQRKGTAPCRGFTALSPSPSSSSSSPCLPPQLRQHAPTKTAVGASCPFCGIPSPRSSLKTQRTAAVPLIQTASVTPEVCRARVRRTDGAPPILEAFVCRTRARFFSFLLLGSRGALYGHLFSLDNGPNGALTTAGGLRWNT